MKIKTLMAVIAALLGALVMYVEISESRRIEDIHTLPSLPKPIAEEYALITSAGQGIEAYIIGDIANKFMIHNYFMPQARKEDLEGVKTLVFVVGYSSVGEILHETSYKDEKNRIIELLKHARDNDLAVITVFMGGKQQRNKKTDELLRFICKDSDYLIGTKEANSDGFLSELAKGSGIPVTLVNGVEDLAEPFTSAFR